MTVEEIEQSKIVKAIYINNKWKVSVFYNDNYYGFRVEGASEITDTDLSDLVYKELFNTDVIAVNEVVTLVENETIINTTPIIKG